MIRHEKVKTEKSRYTGSLGQTTKNFQLYFQVQKNIEIYVEIY